MKRRVLLGVLALIVAAASFGVFYSVADRPAVRRAAARGNTMEWLRAEFHLNDAQFAKIEKLHEDFGRVCTQHCNAIMDARRTGASSEEIGRLQDVCVTSMLDHFREVAACMPPGEGDRYLAIVLPRIKDYDHTQSPTIGVRH